MAGNQLSFEERKFVLRCYWKTENATEVQRRFTSEFAKPPPTRRTIARIRDKFEADGTVQYQQETFRTTTDIYVPWKRIAGAGNTPSITTEITSPNCSGNPHVKR